jgi:calcium-dependent protein kinase
MSIPINQENLIWGKKGLPQSNYVRGKSLGKGAYGNVYESRNPTFNNKVAMKIIDKNKIELDEINDDIKREINILKKLSHPNIVKIYEFYESDNCFYIINEYCKGGQLYEYLTKNKLTEEQLCVIFYQVFSGLIYLHEHSILHGDLKPENILISSVEKDLETNEDFAWIKIIDFGTAKIFKKQIKKGENIEGTLYYIAPEVFSGNIDIYDEKSDIWSIGIILYRALTRKYPFIGRNEDETISFIIDKDHDCNNELLLGHSNEIQDLIKKLLKKDPNERPSAQEALNHEWFKKFNPRRLFTNFKKEEMKPFIDNLCNFSFTKIHQLVIAFLVHNLPETESSQKILKLFRYFNESGNCELSKEELKKGLKEFKEGIEIDDKLDNIFKELDGDKNGFIEFEEFLRACIDKKEILNDKYLSYAFRFLDKQNKKLLSPQQIISAFFSEENNNALKETMNKILSKNDYDKNGLISFEEFKNIIYSLDKVK